MTKAAHGTTEHAHRVALKEELAKRISRSLADHEVDQCDVAKACAVGPSFVQRWASKSEKIKPGLADVVLAADASRPLALDLLTWAAEKIGARVVEAVTVSAADLLTALTSSVKESGELHTALLESMADGRQDDDELRRIAKEAGDTERAAAAIREAAVQELARRAPRARA